MDIHTGYLSVDASTSLLRKIHLKPVWLWYTHIWILTHVAGFMRWAEILSVWSLEADWRTSGDIHLWSTSNQHQPTSNNKQILDHNILWGIRINTCILEHNILWGVHANAFEVLCFSYIWLITDSHCLGRLHKICQAKEIYRKINPFLNLTWLTIKYIYTVNGSLTWWFSCSLNNICTFKLFLYSSMISAFSN